MKLKKILSAVSIFSVLGFFSFISCSEHSTDLETKENVNVEQQFLAKKTVYTLHDYKVLIGNTAIQLGDYSFTIDDSNNEVALVNFSGYSIRMVGSTPIISTPTYTGAVASHPNLAHDVPALILTFLLEDLEGNHYDGNNASIVHSSGASGGCSMWDTYYTIGFGFSSAASMANCVQLVKDNALEFDGCTEMGEMETTDKWGIYKSVITWCCR
ncbi:hypothetical protein [Flavobacterium sp.]|uniref:hypothetical protein n=1 Tax=Flavobacterium sp. TaxID=239 RepID=UPI002605FF69|nr:hypothetical protein [Flavobacterium sp.]MDD3004964.1 hypothetical protein [Flavobacterium sp.]